MFRAPITPLLAPTHYPAPLAIASPLKAALSSIATQPSPTPTTSRHPPAMPGVSFMGDAFYPLPLRMNSKPSVCEHGQLGARNLAVWEHYTSMFLKDCKEPTTDMLVGSNVSTWWWQYFLQCPQYIQQGFHAFHTKLTLTRIATFFSCI